MTFKRVFPLSVTRYIHFQKERHISVTLVVQGRCQKGKSIKKRVVWQQRSMKKVGHVIRNGNMDPSVNSQGKFESVVEGAGASCQSIAGLAERERQPFTLPFKLWANLVIS